MSSTTDFQAKVKASEWSFEENRWNGEKSSTAFMMFDGVLLGFNWKPIVEKLDIKDVSFYLKIDFTDSDEDEHFLQTLEDAAFPAGKSRGDYFGHIRMFRNGMGGISTSVGISLRRSLFPEFLALRSDECLFETYHDLVAAPNANNIVALVRSAKIQGFNPEQ